MMAKTKKQEISQLSFEPELEIDMNDASLFEFQRADDSTSEHIAAPKYSYWGSVFRRFFSNILSNCSCKLFCFTFFPIFS